MQKVVVYGAGSWGTSIAHTIAMKRDVGIFCRNQELAHNINHFKENNKYLPGINLSDKLHAFSDIDLLDLKESDLLILAIPSYALDIHARAIMHRCSGAHVLIATKGFATNPTGLFAAKLANMTTGCIGFLSGPNFARELAVGVYTKINVASNDLDFARAISNLLMLDHVAVEVTQDIAAMQVVSAMKNIIAIASGIYNAKGYGENTRALLISDGLMEIIKVMELFNAQKNTLLNTTAIGDLVLTCYSSNSRNTKFGYNLMNTQMNKRQLLQEAGVVEGVFAARAISSIMQQYNLELPICNLVIEQVDSLFC
nr:NAD(P)H-dependent glycerol-3-phosphate dehydrogenase [Candidatus Sarmatiella mevalonica]